MSTKTPLKLPSTSLHSRLNHVRVNFVSHNKFARGTQFANPKMSQNIRYQSYNIKNKQDYGKSPFNDSNKRNPRKRRESTLNILLKIHSGKKFIK